MPSNYAITNPLYSSASHGHTITEIESASTEANAANINSDEVDDYGLWIGSKSIHLAPYWNRLVNQFVALIKKRYIHSIRNKVLIISQIVIPIAVLLINLFYLKYAPIKAGDSPMLKIDIARYGKNYIPYTLDTENTKSTFVRELAKIYTGQYNSSNLTPFNLKDNSTVDMCADRRASIDDFISCLGGLSLNYIIDNYMIATDFEENEDNVTLVGHFNNQPYHVPPLVLNSLTNVLFKYYTNSTQSKITVTNHPLPRNLKEKITDIQLKDMTGFNVGSGLTFGFSFLIASFVIFLIKEKSSNAKHLQYMSGCNSHIFWISALLWDILNYMVAVAIVMILLKVFQINEFMGANRWLYVFGLLTVYGFAHISQIYLLSYLFKVSATGFATMVGWNILSSQATLTPVAILTLPQLDLVDVSNALEWLFIIIFPNFAFG